MSERTVHSGTAQAGTATTLTLSMLADAVQQAFKNHLLRLTSGAGSEQERNVSSYDGPTKIATVDPRWATNILERPDDLTATYWGGSIDATADGDGWFTVTDSDSGAIQTWAKNGATVPEANEVYVASIKVKKASGICALRLVATGGTQLRNYTVALDAETGEIDEKNDAPAGDVGVEDEGDSWRLWARGDSEDHTTLNYQFFAAWSSTSPSENFSVASTGSQKIKEPQLEKADAIGEFIGSSAAITLPDSTTGYDVVLSEIDPVAVALADAVVTAVAQADAVVTAVVQADAVVTTVTLEESVV